MRKLLLASAAVFGVTAGAAQAATFAPTPASRDSTAFSAPQKDPAPGTIIVRLGGLMDWNFGVVGSNIDKGQNGTPNAGAKLQPYGFQGYFRLYFGVDGKLNNGIIYGANAEMRTNFAGSQPPGYAASAGQLANASANSTASTWYTRRAFAYVGAPQFGLIRVGQGDGPLSLFNGTTTSEAFSSGGWDGDGPSYFGNAAVAWPFLDVGNEYTSNKVAYVSPTIAGFTFGASFAPSSAVLEANGGVGVNAATGGFDRQSSSTLASDLSRPRNLWEVAGRYSNTFGPVGVYFEGGHLGSTTVKNATPFSNVGFYGLDVWDGGAALSFAGFTLNGHISAGKMNGAATPQPKVAGGKNGLAFVVGGQYTIGSLAVGAAYHQFESTGSASPTTGNRMERGYNVGADWTITNGFDLMVDYLYGTRYERGVNFIDPAGPANQGNKTRAQGVITTLLVRW